MKKITSKNLFLKPLDEDELSQYILTLTDEHLVAAYSEILKEMKSVKKRKQKWHTLWQILRKNDNALVGTIAFLGEVEYGTVEIGFGIDEEFRQHGYASEAVKKLCKSVCEQDNIYFVIAKTEKDNVACISTLNKSGFTEIGEDDELLTFEYEKPKSSYMSIYMCLGLSLGMCFGSASDNISLGLCIGLAIGLGVGILLDNLDGKKREKFRLNRENQKNLTK